MSSIRSSSGLFLLTIHICTQCIKIMNQWNIFGVIYICLHVVAKKGVIKPVLYFKWSRIWLLAWLFLHASCLFLFSIISVCAVGLLCLSCSRLKTTLSHTWKRSLFSSYFLIFRDAKEMTTIKFTKNITFIKDRGWLITYMTALSGVSQSFDIFFLLLHYSAYVAHIVGVFSL